MTLNATVLVQILNFFITWAVVRYLFVHPAIKTRDAVYGTLKDLTAERDQLREAITVVREEEYRAWHLWYLQVHKSINGRYQRSAIREPVSIRVSTPEVPAHEIEKVAHQLTALVTRRIQEMP